MEQISIAYFGCIECRRCNVQKQQFATNYFEARFSTVFMLKNYCISDPLCFKTTQLTLLVQGKQQKHQNDLSDVVQVFLLLTLSK